MFWFAGLLGTYLRHFSLFSGPLCSISWIPDLLAPWSDSPRNSWVLESTKRITLTFRDRCEITSRMMQFNVVPKRMAAVVGDASSKENGFNDTIVESVVLFVIVKKLFVSQHFCTLGTIGQWATSKGYKLHQLLHVLPAIPPGCCDSRHINMAAFLWPSPTRFINTTSQQLFTELATINNGVSAKKTEHNTYSWFSTDRSTENVCWLFNYYFRL